MEFCWARCDSRGGQQEPARFQAQVSPSLPFSKGRATALSSLSWLPSSILAFVPGRAEQRGEAGLGQAVEGMVLRLSL